MTTIVSGAKGSAKTRRLLELYGTDQRGDGFVSEAVAADAITAGSGPVYIDEIGKLELRGGGFARLLRQLPDN